MTLISQGKNGIIVEVVFIPSVFLLLPLASVSDLLMLTMREKLWGILRTRRKFTFV